MKNLVLSLIALFIGVMSWGQTIVNTETLMLNGDSGFVWTAGVGGDASFGNSDVVDVSADAGFTKDWGRTAIKLVSSWNRLAEEGSSIQSSSFAHLRGEFGNVDQLQVFGFVQTSSNDVLNMTTRNLIGTGLKRRLIEGEGGWLALSWGAFYEVEQYSMEIPTSEMLRNSVVLSGGKGLGEHVFVRVTSYAQSDFRNFSDSRVFVEWTWDISIRESVALEWNLAARWDGDPHGGLEPLDVGTTVGLRFGYSGE